MSYKIREVIKGAKDNRDRAVTLADKLVARFLKEAPPLTFGEWVLLTFYSGVVFNDVVIDRDFRFARRTSDARTYLIGFLLSGIMSIQDLES